MKKHPYTFKKVAIVIATVACSVLFGNSVSAATVTWDGGGADNNMTTAANWSSDTAPMAGDDLVFPAGVSKVLVTNDFTAGTVFGSFAFSGDSSSNTSYTISGNAVTISGNISTTQTGVTAYVSLSLPITTSGSPSIVTPNGNLGFTFGQVTVGSGGLTVNVDDSSYLGFDGAGALSGAGTLTKIGNGTVALNSNPTFTGTINVTGGYLAALFSDSLGDATGSTNIFNGTSLILGMTTDVAMNENFTLRGTGVDVGDAPLILANYGFGGGGGPGVIPTITLNGSVTIFNNIDVILLNRNLKINGPLTGSYTIKPVAGGYKYLEIASSNNGTSTPNGIYESQVLETNYSGNNISTSLYIDKNNIGIVSGSFGNTSIDGGTLKGTGTVSELSMSSGTLAPGLSPGCLNSGNFTATGGTYQVELGGTAVCSGYDSLNVTGTVVLGSATSLDLVHFNNFRPAKNNQFIIISNDGSDAVSGTFSGLAESGQITLDGTTYRISYVAGDGNDVGLTAVTVPASSVTPTPTAVTAPDTGFKVSLSSMTYPVAMTIVGLGILIHSKFKKSAVKVKK